MRCAYEARIDKGIKRGPPAEGTARAMVSKRRQGATEVVKSSTDGELVEHVQHALDNFNPDDDPNWSRAPQSTIVA
jgi:hypothetical protein